MTQILYGAVDPGKREKENASSRGTNVGNRRKAATAG